MDCHFEKTDENTWTCSLCGFVWTGERTPRRNCRSRGLGDTIAKATRAVGIKPCGGCKDRQKKLNEIFPYKGTE